MVTSLHIGSKWLVLVLDFRRHPLRCPPSQSSAALCSPWSISHALMWVQNMSSILKKAQQWMYFLQLLGKHGLLHKLLLQFYTAFTELVLCTSITVWFGAAIKQDKSRLQCNVRTDEGIVGAPRALYPGLDRWQGIF